MNSVNPGPIDMKDGLNAVGILADSGTILNEHNGLPSTSITGPVQVSATNVSSTGQWGAAISATAGNGGVTVNILPGGSVMGGWQADLTSVGPTYSLPAAGVILSSAGGTATLTNSGNIGALSDRAVTDNPQMISNTTSIINNGTTTVRSKGEQIQLVGGYYAI
jgi:hypothetical protein